MRSRRGAALILTILLVALLSVVVVEFLRESRLEARAAGNLRDSLQAHALVRSGVAVAAALLLDDAEDNATDNRGETWAGVLPQVPLGDGILGVSVSDLEGRFPLGALVDGDGRAVPSVVEAYRRLLEAVDPEDADIAALVDALVDWVDADTDGPYEDNPDYRVPNAVPVAVDELARVEGYDPRLVAELAPFLDVRASRKVNINTAPAEVIAAMHPDLDPDRARELYEDLTETPLERVSDLRRRPAMEGIAITQFVLDPEVSTRRFELRVTADVKGVVRQATAVLERDTARNRVLLLAWREE